MFYGKELSNDDHFNQSFSRLISSGFMNELMDVILYLKIGAIFLLFFHKKRQQYQ